MKRLDIVNAKLKKLYAVLFDLSNPRDNQEEIKNQIIKYERERTLIYSKEYYKRLKEMPWLSENDIYKQIITHNAEFDYLFLELIQKCPRIINDLGLLLPILDFINGGMELLLPNTAITNSGNNKIAKLRELLTLNRNVLADTRLLSRINDPCYPQIKDILKSITLMSNQKFRDYLARTNILKNRNYTNICLMERAFREGLSFDLVLALGSDNHAKNYFSMNMSKELLDQVHNAKTKILKKQILSIIYDCNDDKILNILVRFFEIDDVREQLLDENSFYYNFLIKPIYMGISHREYGSIDELLSTCSKGFDNYILACNNTDILSHAFDCITGPYIYYHNDRRVHAVPANKFTSSFNNQISQFHQALEMVNMLDDSISQEYLSQKYENILNDDLKVIATRALIENEDTKMSEEELKNWNMYIAETYGYKYDEAFDNNIQVTICYGLDSFDEPSPITPVYPHFTRIINSSELYDNKLVNKAK